MDNQPTPPTDQVSGVVQQTPPQVDLASPPSVPETSPPTSQPSVAPIEAQPPLAPKSHLPVRFLIAGIGIPAVIVSIVVGYYIASNPRISSRTPSPTPTPVNIEPTPQALFLDVGTQVGSIDGEVLVSGRTLPNTTVVMYSDQDESIVRSDTGGSFEGSFIMGGGQISVTAIAEDGSEKEVTLEVVDTQEVLGESTQGRAVRESEDGDDDITPEKSRRMPVEPENAGPDVKRQTIRVGKVTPYEELEDGDKEEEDDLPRRWPSNDKDPVLDTKRIGEFIKIASKSSQLDVLKKRGVTQLREIFTYSATRSATLAQDIKVRRLTMREATSPATLRRHALSGIITATGEGSITITHMTARDRSAMIYYNADTKVTTTDGEQAGVVQFAVGMRVAAVGEPVGDSLLAKRIHIIPGKAVGIRVNHPLATAGGSLTATPSATMEPSQDTATPSLSPTIEAQ